VSSQDDLTARARIRDAAIRLFAERGIGTATIRDIAAEAGVSSGLVRHHFGSKEALRDTCDAFAVDRMNQLREEMFAGGKLGDTGFMTTVEPTARLLTNYLVQSMLDGSPAAQKMFDDAVEQAERYSAGLDIADRRGYAAVLCATQLGVFLMRDQLSRVLGIDVRTPEGHRRMMLAFAEIFAHPLLTPQQLDQIRKSA
jgi:AcrR family transcriptional regulator